MYEFNPFDDLGINPDSNNRLNETWRDRSYSEKLGGSFNDSQSIPTDSQPEYQPDFDTPLVDVSNPKDYQVISELGIIAPNKMNEEERQNYVDNLSDEDWKIWNQLKDEGYSFEIRKAMFDNRDDLYDIAEPGNKKFWSANKSETMQTALDLIQDAVDYQEDKVHPWSQSKQEYLDLVANELYSDTFENIYQEKYQDYLNTDNRLLRRVKSASMLPVSVVQRGATIAGGMLVDLAKDGIGLMDHLGNIGVQLFAAGGNKIAGYDKGYDLVQIDPESPNILGSYIKGVKDFLGAGFTLAYPFATWLLTTIGTESENVQKLMNATHGGIKRFAKEIFETIGLKHFNLDSLSEEELDAFYDDIVTGVFIIFADLTGKGINWLGKRQAIKDFLFIKNIAQETSEIGRQEIINQVKETGKTMEKEPVGTEFRTEGGTKMAEVTPNGVRTTPYGKLRILQKVLGGRVNGWIRGFQRALEEVMNKDKLVTRDPNAPVGELPVPDVKIRDEEVKNPGEGEIKEGEIKEPTVEEKPTEVKNPKDEIKTTGGGTKTDIKDSTLKTKSEGNSGIGDFIKKTINKLTGKQGGMDKELFEKFSSSPDLQNEYINTIDPYLKSNGSENPAGVIENQLSDFVETVKEQLEDRRNNNIEFQKGQMKHKVQIPESDKIKRNQENTEIKNLIRTLSKQSADPEKFLNYLLNLPEEKVQALNKFIPNFSNNLALIKDTLDLTKAITSSDLLGKFLQYKSTWGTKRRNFIRRYLWKKLKQAYEKAGIKRNMYEIEKMLNKMSDEQLVELESSIESDKDLPNFVKQDFLDQIEYSLDRERWIKSENSKFPVKGTDPETTWKTLIRQGYINPKTNKPFKTKEEIENYVLPNGRTVKQFLADANYKLEHKYNIDENVAGATDLIERTIKYYGDIDKLPEYLLQHEVGHIFLGSLTTAEYLDLIEGFTKATKSLKKYDPNLKISEYKSLAKSEVGATEFMSDSIGLFLTYMDINGMGDYLQPYLSPDLGSKVKKILNDIGKDLRDDFSTVEVNGKKFTPSEEVSKLTERGLNDKEFMTRQHNDLDKAYNEGIGYKNRLADWQRIDPNVDFYKWDLDFKSDNFGKMIIKLKDGRKLTWEEYKDTLTPELRDKLYEDREIQDSSSEYWKNKIKEDKQLAEFRSSNDGLSKYKEDLRNIDTDIVGLKEKDGQIYVQYLMESQRERYELPDRPGYVEVKEVPAYDYFSEEDFKKLPKELQEMIGEKTKIQDSEGEYLSKNQVDYFKDSKVRDKNGDLLLVFHGTPSGGFKERDSRTVGSASFNEGFFGAGMYFTPDKYEAKEYMGYGDKKDNSEIKMGYLDIKNPFNFGRTYTEQEYQDILKKLDVTEEEFPARKLSDGDRQIYNLFDVYSMENNNRSASEKKEIFGNLDPNKMLQGFELTSVLKDAGYDGARGDYGVGEEWVIFDSKQFKDMKNIKPTNSPLFDK